MDRTNPLVLHDAIVVTGDAAQPVLWNAGVALLGNRIADVGPSREITARYAGAELISARGRIIASGLANCHAHLSRIHGRGIMDDQNAPNTPPFSRAGFLRMPRLSAQERDVFLRLAVLEAIKSGTSAIMEVGSGLAVYAELLGRSGLRVFLAEQVSDRPAGAIVGNDEALTFDASQVTSSLNRIRTLHEGFDTPHNGLIRVAAAAHAPDMVSPDLFRELARLQDELAILSTVHLSQYWGEVRAIQKTFGVSPPQHLVDLGYLRSGVIAVHCRCTEAAEDEVIARSGASVCYTPAVSARSGNSCRAVDLEAAGATLCVGTDEFTQDMFEVVRTGLLLERVRLGDSMRPQSDHAWNWGTRGGYAALGMPDAGAIRAGNLADLIMVDAGPAHLAPNVRPAANLVHHARAGDVTDLMVDGQWVMRDRKVLTLDETSVVQEAEEAGRRAWSRAVAAAPAGTRAPPGIYAGD
jgi:5-methylthioadenosine/S-adenosylhomocysteine deaminase